MKTQGKRAGTLLRVSTGRQNTDGQSEGVDEFIAERGLVPGPEFNLTGKSAYHGKQVKGVRAAILAHKNGEYDVFVIRRIDRLDRRGIRKGWALVDELLDGGVPVLSAEDPELERMQDGEDSAEFSISAKLYVAREESKAKAGRAHDERNKRLRKGLFPGGAVPRGYVLVNAVEGKDDEGKRLVVADGNDIAEIMEEVVKNPVRVVGMKHGMTGPGVALLVRNRVYSAGLYVSGKGTHECEPIVSPTVQEKAIMAINARTPKTSGRRSKGEDLSGRVRCEHGNVLYRNRGTYNPKTGVTCHCTFRLPDVHELIQREMDASGQYEVIHEWVPGDGGEVAVTRIKAQLDLLDISTDEGFARAVELRAQLKEAENTVTEGYWQTRRGDRKIGDIWRDASWEDRRRLLDPPFGLRKTDGRAAADTGLITMPFQMTQARA